MLITALTAAWHMVDGRPAPDERLASVGRPTKVSTVATLGDDELPLPQGEIGEICVRGDFTMVAYDKDPQVTADAARNGWHAPEKSAASTSRATCISWTARSTSSSPAASTSTPPRSNG
ncbi:AMP-binding protein [Streptomyces monashensis]|uniref:AMP-binding protein n=1 Tax=Streptomyces monashensis TaxID=1678012 RepID=UPI001C42FCA6|nr:AMP-binding protein [Streptomyces monashensis]